MLKIVACLFVLVFFLSFHPPVFADSNVLINEFYALGSGDDPDWVELYNKSDSPINLEDWVIRDETDSNKIDLDGYICQKNFRRFNFSNRLTNGGDKIRLFDLESATLPQDEIVYFSDAIPVHSQGQSTGRNPDGASTWVLMTSPTPTDDNSCTLAPTPSPSPSPTPSTSSTSTATPTPTPKTTSTIATKSPSPTSAKQSPSVLSASDQDSLLLASLSAETSSPSPSPEATPSAMSKTKVAGILAGSGIVLISLSFGFYLWYKKIFRSSPAERDAGLKKALEQDLKEKENGD